MSQTDVLNTWATARTPTTCSAPTSSAATSSAGFIGARTSLAVAVTVWRSPSLIGVMLGMAAGYFGGWVDTAIMRDRRHRVGFPEMVFAILVAALSARASLP